MAKFHITESGDPGVCRAQAGNCPYGAEAPHFSSKQEAREAYERSMEPVTINQKQALKSLDLAGLRNSLTHEASELGLNVELIEKAADFATILHEGQYRSAAPREERPPYITHPLRNAIRVMRWGSESTDIVLGAILHDVVEDSSEKYAEVEGISIVDEEDGRRQLLARIRADFGDRVADAVHGLSNPILTNHQRFKATPEERRAIYKNHVKEAIKDNHDVLLIKLSDFHDNAAGLYHTDFEHRKAQTMKQTLKYLETLPVFEEELERNPFENKKIHEAAIDSINIINARLKWMLAKKQV